MKISAASLAILCGFLGVWQLGEKLSPDALGMMVGLIFGALAGIPAALLVLYAVRNSPPAEAPPTPPTRWIIVERPAAIKSPPAPSLSTWTVKMKKWNRRGGGQLAGRA